jgi:signal transduction histidine kinase
LRKPGIPSAELSAASVGAEAVVDGAALAPSRHSISVSGLRRWKPAAIAAVACAGAVWVGYETSRNPTAWPPHLAVAVRVTIILALTLAGFYAQTKGIQRRMGSLLAAAGLFSCLWLMNGSARGALFGIGVSLSGLAPGVFYYLLLAYPTGRLSPSQWRLIAVTSAMIEIAVLLGVLVSSELPVTPLVHCAAHCPREPFNLGFDLGAAPFLKWVIYANLLVLGWATPVLLVRRYRAASLAVRTELAPMVIVAFADMALVTGFVIGSGTDPAANVFGVAYVALIIGIPVAIFVGMYRERLFMAHALAGFLTQLSRTPQADLETAMAEALRDPSLKIAYPRPDPSAYVDSLGMPVDGVAEDRASTLLEREGRPVALVSFDAKLADQAQFVQAAGETAILWLEKERLAADLTASLGDLSSSRRRLADAGHAERRRIQRDLHDGAQQHLLTMRVKLELALEALKTDRARGEGMLTDIGVELDETLEHLRSLSSGVYPPVLGQYGLVEALRSAARRMAIPVSVGSSGIRRHPEEVETAVYFSCMEALQNVSKHAGPNATATLELAEWGGWLRFEIRDSGMGFATDGVRRNGGMQNMRDRVDTVGGTLEIRSTPGAGTVILGRIPVARRAAEHSRRFRRTEPTTHG